MKDIPDIITFLFILLGIIFVIGGFFADRPSRTIDPADYYDWRNEMQ